MRAITLCAVALVAGCGGSASSMDAHFVVDQDSSIEDLQVADALAAVDLADVDLRSPDLAPAFDLAPPAAGCPVISPPACYSTTVQAGRDANLNTELNDWAAIYLDAERSDTTSCRALALQQLNAKIDADSDWTYWLSGATVTHAFAAAIELQAAGLAVDDVRLRKIRDSFWAPDGMSHLPVPQDTGCAVYTNGCMDDYALTATGLAWIAAYERRQGRSATPYIDAARATLSSFFAPMLSSTGTPASGALCYLTDGAAAGDANLCGGDATKVGSGVTIRGVGHFQENPSYGLGLMTSVASACLALYQAGAPCDFSTVDGATGRTWKQNAIALLLHARSRTVQSVSPPAFSADCINFGSAPFGVVSCADPTYGYSPEHYPLHRFYANKLGYDFASFLPGDYAFDSFDAGYACRHCNSLGSGNCAPDGTMYDRASFFGYNRYVIYNLFANQAWPGGPLNAHFATLATCGDGSCGASESHLVCPADCP